MCVAPHGRYDVLQSAPPDVMTVRTFGNVSLLHSILQELSDLVQPSSTLQCSLGELIVLRFLF